MQSAATHTSLRASDEAAPVFSVVIVYEDFATGKQAKRACEFLMANLSHEWQVTCQMWKFEVLSIPELCEMAAKDAAMADLIVVSSHGEAGLPTGVKNWIKTWRGCEGGAVALVALFDSPAERAGHAQATQAYLADIAKRGQMEFFAWPDVGPGKESGRELLLPVRRWETGGEILVPLAAAAPSAAGFSHWGINK